MEDSLISILNPRIFSLSLVAYLSSIDINISEESFCEQLLHSIFVNSLFSIHPKKIAVTVAHVLLHYLQAFGFYINIYAIWQEARHYEAVVTSQFALQADLYFTSKAVLHVSLVYFGMLDGLLAKP
ncbi:hypothetical protein ACJX0J_024598 [Zea mays]